MNLLFIYLNQLKNYFKVLKLIIFNSMKVKNISFIELSGDFSFGENIRLGNYVKIEGLVTLGNDVIIEDNCSIKDCEIKNGSIIKKGSILNGSKVGEKGISGPYGRLRRGSKIKDLCQIGNCVEIKNSAIGINSKINHLAFVGDSEVGNNVIIGAGVVTCNYDGNSVQKTIIKNDCFIGSGTYLIAPIKIGSKAVVGSGSVITEDIESKKLVLARSKQIVIENWTGFKKND